MFNILWMEIDVTADLIGTNKTFTICLLTISLSIFLLILSIEYINMKYINYCDFERPENVEQIHYSQCSSNYTGTMTDFTEDSYLSFFPDVYDVEIMDEYNILDPPRMVELEISKNADSVGKEIFNISNVTMDKWKKRKDRDRVLKFFQQVLTENPNNDEVLTHYGEFLEIGGNVFDADHFYLKAIMLNPKNSRALTNHKRTLPIVIQLDHEELKRIDSKRTELMQLNKVDPTLKQLKKEIYFQYIYHTVALEGNTMSLAETQKVIETKLPVTGKSIVEYNEILGVETALHYMNQSLASNKREIFISDILEIHKRVLGHVDKLAAGTYRKIQVYVGKHQAPAASEVELLMEEFVRVLRSSHIRNMHPIHIAAFVHYNLVFIHPFLDGNGRTARLLMNLIALRYGYPPVVIRKQEKDQYIKSLDTANEGDHRPFYRFIAHAAEYTIDAFLRAHEFEQSNLEVLESTHDIKEVIVLGY